MASSFGQIGSANSAKTFCRIVGLSCLAGFAASFLMLMLPPNPLALDWRLGFMQQVGNRSIVLLLGAALTLYGCVDSRPWLRQVSIVSLLVGIVFSLSCLLVVHDISALGRQSLQVINEQTTELQTQIQQAQSNPASLPENFTSEQLAEASQLVAEQSKTLIEQTKSTGVRAGVVSVGNLLIAGLGLITIGRYGVRLRRG